MLINSFCSLEGRNRAIFLLVVSYSSWLPCESISLLSWALGVAMFVLLDQVPSLCLQLVLNDTKQESIPVTAV